MKREIIYSCAAIMMATSAVTSSSAQVNKEVEVTQAYVPKIKEATKPTLHPNMEDDAYIAPDIDYSITPTSIHTPLESDLYKPVELNYWEYKRMNDYYAKVGVGYPWRSVVDLYATKSRSDKGYFNAFVNQEGNYAKIANDYGESNNSTESHLRVGSTAGLYLGRKVLEGGVAYENDLWSRYATSGSSDNHPKYQRLGLDLMFGDNFSDMNRWNFAVGAGARHMWSNSNFDNTSVGARIDIGRSLGEGSLRINALMNYISGNEKYRNTTFGFGARYELEGVISSVIFGVDLYNDNISQQNIDSKPHFTIIPHLYFDQRIFEKRLIAYLKLDGELRHNDYASLSRRNPYIEAGWFGEKSSVNYDLDFGVKGVIGDSRLNYNLFVGYEIATDEAYWIYSQEQITTTAANNRYFAEFADLSCLSVDLEVNYRPVPAFEMELAATVNKYFAESGVEWSVARPKTELSIGGRYRVGGFALGVKGELEGLRKTTQLYTDLMGGEYFSTIKTPTTFNLSADAEYKLNCGVVVFCELTNLLNDDLYEWARYREYGIGGLIGAKFEF